MSALETFRARCQAAVHDYALGVDLITVVDWLQDWAFTRGLVDEIGQDTVQAEMAEAFGPLRDEQPRDEEHEGLSSTFARACQLADAEYARTKQVTSPPACRLAQSTIQATEYLVRLNDPARLRAWLIEKTPAERGLVLAYFEDKKGRRAA